MIKLRNMLLTAIAIVGFSTASYAGTASIGIVTSLLDVSASGSETDTLTVGGAAVADTSIRTKSVEDTTFTGSLFAEYTIDSAWALTAGFELTPGKADMGGKFTRTDTETSISNTAGSVSNSKIRSVEAVAKNFGTIYIEAPIWKALYVRAGASNITIDYDTVTPLGGGAYSDSINLSGTNLGVGIKGELGSFNYKLAYEETDYGDFSMKSNSGGVAVNSNSVKGDIDTEAFRFSLSKSF